MLRRRLTSLLQPETATMLDAGSLFRRLNSYVRLRLPSVAGRLSTGLPTKPVSLGSYVPTRNANGLGAAFSQEPDLGRKQNLPLGTQAALLLNADPNRHGSCDLPASHDLQWLIRHAEVCNAQSSWSTFQVATTSAVVAPIPCLSSAATGVGSSDPADRQLSPAPILPKDSMASGGAERIAASSSLSNPATKPSSIVSLQISISDQKNPTTSSSTPTGVKTAEVTEVNGVGDVGLAQLDVRAFGAVGDGMTDDSIAIQNAELAASAQGKKLFFGPGTYLINEKIYLHSNDNVLGSGMNTVLEMGSGLDTIFALNGSPADQNGNISPIKNVTVSGIQFDGSASSNLNEGPLVVCYIADGVNFSNDGFRNTNGIGILFSNTKNSTVNSSSFFDIGNKPLMTKNLVDAAQGIAFCDSSIIDSSNNTVENSSFTSIGLDAISASDQTSFFISNNFMVGLNVISGWDNYSAGAAGIYLTRNNEVVATGNYIEGASGNGIDLYKNNNVLVSGNTIAASGSGGIAISDTSHAVITNNISKNNNQYLGHFIGQAGIFIIGNANELSSSILIQGNRSEDTQTTSTQSYGFQIVTGTPTSDITVSGNYFGGNVIAASNVNRYDSQNTISRSVPKDIIQFVTGTLSPADAGFLASTSVTNSAWTLAPSAAQSLGTVSSYDPQVSNNQLFYSKQSPFFKIEHGLAF